MFEETTFIDDAKKLSVMKEIPYKSSELIYRFSATDFKAETFHEICQGKAPTICFFLTKRGRIWGAFTDIPWKSDGEFAKANGNTFCFCFEQDNDLIKLMCK